MGVSSNRDKHRGFREGFITSTYIACYHGSASRNPAHSPAVNDFADRILCSKFSLVSSSLFTPQINNSRLYDSALLIPHL